MRLARILFFVLTVAGLARAQRPPVERATIDGTVTAIGTAPRSPCGEAMATQDLEIRVSRVRAGKVSAATLTVRVPTCFLSGPLLRQNPNHPGLLELDPSKIRVGSTVTVDAEESARGVWFATADKIAVTAR